MILILEDDADREAFQRETPFVFFRPESSLRTPTVWVNVEAYEEKVRADERDHGWQEGYDAGIAYAVEKYQHTWSTRLADLRAEVEALRGDEWADRRPVANGYRRALDDVLALLDGAASEIPPD
jgi:hypothetical protein